MIFPLTDGNDFGIQVLEYLNKPAAMSSFFKISDAASLAIHAMLRICETPDRPVSIKEIASHIEASQAHLGKVLQRLVHVGLVQSTRGPKGGFALARPAGEIALLDIYEAIDGSLPDGCCLFRRPVCRRNLCVFGGLLHSAARQIHDYMAEAKLSALAGGESV